MVALAVVLGVVLPHVDAAVDGHLTPGVRSFVFGGGASEARQLLSSIASGLITTVSLTFSLTVVVFQLASSQYSPRLLRLFPRDGVTRATLGLLAGTFVYALTLLRTVREDQVPRFSVTLAFVLTAAGVLLLVVFLGHIVTELRVETMLRRVHREHDRVVEDLFVDTGPAATGPSTPFDDDDWMFVATRSSGFVVAVDEADLVDAARDAGALVEILRTVGDHVTAGTPLARIHATDAAADLADAVRSAVVVAYERSSAQDLGFGVEQLADVCAKALSPGVNDPTTARRAIGHLASVYSDLVGRDLSPRRLRDPGGALRVVVPQPSFARLLEAGLGPVRTFGSGDVVVLGETMALLQDVAWNAPDAPRRADVAAQRDRLLAAARRDLADPADVEDVAAGAERVTAALRGTWH